MTLPSIAQGTKLGIHALNGGAWLDWVKTQAESGAPFPVVKLVDQPGAFPLVKQYSPKTLTLFRATGGDDLQMLSDNPHPDIDAIATRLIGYPLARCVNERAAIDYIEVCNEDDPPEIWGYVNLARVMWACAEKAESVGVKIATFAFNNGTPTYKEMLAMADTGVFARLKRGGHILTWHAGSVWDDIPIWEAVNGIIPDAPRVPNASPLTLLYRYLYDLLEQRGEVIPLVVSEFYAGLHITEHPDTAFEWATWADTQAREDPYVLALLPYTLSPTPDWAYTDWEQVYPRLMEYAIAIRNAPNHLEPDTMLPPAPTPVLPDPLPPNILYMPLLWFGVIPPQYTQLIQLINNAVMYSHAHGTLAGFIEAEYDKLHPAPGALTKFTGTNQQMINLFSLVFGSAYITLLTRAGILDAALAARAAPYTGPAFESLTLTQAERDKLIVAYKANGVNILP